MNRAMLISDNLDPISSKKRLFDIWIKQSEIQIQFIVSIIYKSWFVLCLLGFYYRFLVDSCHLLIIPWWDVVVILKA